MLASLGFTIHEKIVDTFAASEQSAMFGSSAQRLAAQQDKVAQYLGTIGQMTRQLFQIVRDIRLTKERELLYVRSKGGDYSADKSLKSSWVDLIDNGPQGIKASSIYGMATQLGYTTLPDLFFNTKPDMQADEVDSYVFGDKKKGTKGLDFNDKVRNVLARKLASYVAWRDSTEKEVAARVKFTLRYLRQHYNSIKLYIDWVKPYLKNIKRLTMDREHQISADLIGSFEGSVLETELLTRKPGKYGVYPIVLVTFFFKTRPVMQTGQDYSRGPQHIGRVELTFRAYSWDDDQIAAYKKIKMQEDFEMLKEIDATLADSLESLGDEIKDYLVDAGEKFGEEDEQEDLARRLLSTGVCSTLDKAREQAKTLIEKPQKEKKSSIFEPFTDIGKGFAELAEPFVPFMTKKSKSKDQKELEKKKEAARKGFKGDAVQASTLAYTTYKKAHKLYTP